ncbi:MAG: TolC family protein [Aliidongia sp.]
MRPRSPCSLPARSVPDFEAPPDPTSLHYDQSAENQLAATGGTPGAQHISLDQSLGGDWWSFFGSAKLDDVMRRAIDGNLDLAAADATIAQAAETVKAAEGGLYPQVDFGSQIKPPKDGSLTAAVDDEPLRGRPRRSVSISIFSAAPSGWWKSGAHSKISRSVASRPPT